MFTGRENRYRSVAEGLGGALDHSSWPESADGGSGYSTVLKATHRGWLLYTAVEDGV